MLLTKFIKSIPSTRVAIRAVRFRSTHCWKCGTDISSTSQIICNTCKVIQPLHQECTYFDYFDLKNDFIIDQNQLKKKFREIQTVVHPDKYGLSDEKEKSMADAHSSFANQAYKTLSNTRSRALYMLNQSQVGDMPTDPELAMQMMELNEEIEETNDQDELKAKLNEIEGHINSIIHEMGEHFESEQREEAKKALDRLRYFDRTKKLIQKKIS